MAQQVLALTESCAPPYTENLGFDVRNYPITSANASIQVPTANIFLDPKTKSPLVSEIQASYGININEGKGYAEAAFVYRKTTSLIDDFITRDTGTTHVTLSGIDAGVATTPFLRAGDHVEIAMFDAAGVSIFGAISARVVP